MPKNGLPCLLIQTAGAVVFAAVVTIFIIVATNVFYGSEGSSKRGYTVDIANTPAATQTTAGGGAAPAGEAPKQVDITPYLAKADLGLGAKLIKRCETCHTFDKGKPASVGPNQFGLVGRKVASMSGFEYSDAMKAKGGSWTPQALSDFLTAPQKVVPGTKMGFAGLARPEERAAVIAYINQNFSDNPVNLKEK
jgi:cytochrome c